MDAATGQGARVGPNAILQVSAALRARLGGAAVERVFAAAGLEDLLRRPPEAMVPEEAVARLHRALADGASPPEAEALALDAGRRTADYLLAHRIPRPVQSLLRALPARAASAVLLRAVARNAWTFAGSGRFRAIPGRPAVVEIGANPIATPGCPWHRGVFERLFQVLVSSRATVVQTRCCASGADSCRFELRY